MDYALVIRALERHVGIAERSMQFFRERRMGRQYKDAVVITTEATRALEHVKLMRDLSRIETGLGMSPNPVPAETTEGPTPSASDFPDENLQDGPKHEMPETSPLKPI